MRGAIAKADSEAVNTSNVFYFLLEAVKLNTLTVLGVNRDCSLHLVVFCGAFCLGEVLSCLAVIQ